MNLFTEIKKIDYCKHEIKILRKLQILGEKIKNKNKNYPVMEMTHFPRGLAYFINTMIIPRYQKDVCEEVRGIKEKNKL